MQPRPKPEILHTILNHLPLEPHTICAQATCVHLLVICPLTYRVLPMCVIHFHREGQKDISLYVIIP